MKPRRHRTAGAFTVWFFCLALALPGAEAPARQSPAPSQPAPISLPPMIVAESSKAPPWLYATTADTEYLSRCSAATTRAFITAQLEIQQMLAAFVPAEFFSHSAVPAVSLLAPLALKSAGDDAVASEMLRTEQALQSAAADTDRREGRLPGPSRFEFLPNLRLDDRDMCGVFTYLDETTFSADRMIASHDAVLARLMAASPMLPAWAIEGITGLYLQARVREDPIELQPFRWLSREETELMKVDAEARRVLLPAQELFAPDALLTQGNAHPARVAAWRSQAVLFVRWALDPAHAPAREALWQFIRRVSVEPVSETVFIECFGFGYADLRDRLSDYLPAAVTAPVTLRVGKLPPVARFEVKPASLAQSARLRGDWERLEIPFVRQKHPEFVSRYADQARTTLRRAVGRGENDPMLIAVLGLCELEAGDATAARPWLEKAAAAGVVRPRVHFEVARLRWEELIRGAPPTQSFTAAELQPVIAPLRTALAQAPLLPEVCVLLADVWLRSRDAEIPADLPQLVDAVSRFRRIPVLGLRVALLLNRHQRRVEAAQLLSVSSHFVTDPATRTHYRQLHEALTAPPKKS